MNAFDIRERSDGIGRRAFLLGTGGLAAAAVMGSGAQASSRVARAARTATAGVATPGNRFNLAAPAQTLFANADLISSNSVLQSFAIDNESGHVYAAQVARSEKYDHDGLLDDLSGHLFVSQLTFAGDAQQYMTLLGFGHAVSIAVEIENGRVYLWTECDVRNNGSDSGRGSTIARFPFEGGRTLAADDPSIDRFVPPDGMDELTPALDETTGRLCLRYRDTDHDTYHLKAYDLGAFRGDAYGEAVYPAFEFPHDGTPQGWAVMGNYVYYWTGKGQDLDSWQSLEDLPRLRCFDLLDPAPPGDEPVAIQDVSVPVPDELSGSYEPEGLHIWTDGDQPVALAWGFASNLPGDRKASVYYLDELAEVMTQQDVIDQAPAEPSEDFDQQLDEPVDDLDDLIEEVDELGEALDPLLDEPR